MLLNRSARQLRPNKYLNWLAHSPLFRWSPSILYPLIYFPEISSNWKTSSADSVEVNSFYSMTITRAFHTPEEGVEEVERLAGEVHQGAEGVEAVGHLVQVLVQVECWKETMGWTDQVRWVTRGTGWIPNATRAYPAAPRSTVAFLDAPLGRLVDRSSADNSPHLCLVWFASYSTSAEALPRNKCVFICNKTRTLLNTSNAYYPVGV